jgi:hypothetical protein
MINLIDTMFTQITNSLQLGTLDEKGSVEFLLETAAGIFSLVLFAVTLFAWSRRGRQTSLLLVALAFFLYFSKLLIELLPIGELHDELVSSIMDFGTLTLFFLALVVRPHRSIPAPQKRDSAEG